MSPVVFSTHDQFHRPIKASDFSLHQPIRTNSKEPLTLQFSGYHETFTYLLTYSMQQSPSWEANWFCS